MLRTTVLLVSNLLLMAPVAIAQALTGQFAEGLSPSSREHFERLDDVIVSIDITSGSCPNQVRFWRETRRDFEVGDNSGIMLDVSTISQGHTEFIDSQEHSVTFRTPLAPEFYTCVGNLGESEEHYRPLYSLWFKQGYVYFHFDISPIAPEPHEHWYFATITHQEIVGQYPYVRWAVGD